MKNTVQNIALWFLAILVVTFGFNKFFGFIPVEPPADATAQSFMGAMFTSYLYVIVASAEIIGGVMLVIPKTRFMGWLLLLPVIFNIVAFHIAHDFIGNGIWLIPTILYILISYLQFNNIKKAMTYGFI